MTKANAEQIDHAALAAQSRLLVHLGLLPAGSSLEQLELDLNAGQVDRLLRPDHQAAVPALDHRAASAPVEKLTFSHEFTHALQDQNFGLDKLAIDTADQGDRDLARTALPEGDATLAMTAMGPDEHVGRWICWRPASRPPRVRRPISWRPRPRSCAKTSTFPYQDGKTFVQGIYANGGWAAVTSSTPTRRTPPRRSSTRTCTRSTSSRSL